MMGVDAAAAAAAGGRESVGHRGSSTVAITRLGRSSDALNSSVAGEKASPKGTDGYTDCVPGRYANLRSAKDFCSL